MRGELRGTARGLLIGTSLFTAPVSRVSAVIPDHPAELGLDLRARLNGPRSLPRGDALAEHHAHQRVPVVDPRVVVAVVARREDDAVLVACDQGGA
jgi:hypothetical protein